MTETNTLKSCGDINESGLINSFSHNGMTPERALMELGGNIEDACGKEWDLVITPTSILSIGKGEEGMSEAQLINYGSLYRANHTGEKKNGSRGYGAKAATKKLSGNKEVKYYTKSKDDEYLCMTIPWDKIQATNKYTGNITYRKMTDDEITMFKSYLTDEYETGTICEFPYNEEIHDSISSQFITRGGKKGEQQPLRINKPPMNRLDFIFGKSPMKINYRDTIENSEYTLKGYNPHGFNSPENYLGGLRTGKSSIPIEMYTNEKGIILFATPSKTEEIYNYIMNSEKNSCPKEPKEGKIPRGFKFIETFTLNMTCIKPVDEYFNPANPALPSTTGMAPQSDYERAFYGSGTDYLECRNNTMLLSRNNVRVSIIDLGPKTAQGGSNTAKDKFVKLHIQTELSYDPISDQDNLADDYIGIQINKHQHCPDYNKLKPLVRMCEWTRKNFAEGLWNYMEEIIPSPPDNSSDDDTSDDDISDDEDDNVSVIVSVSVSVSDENDVASVSDVNVSDVNVSDSNEVVSVSDEVVSVSDVNVSDVNVSDEVVSDNNEVVSDNNEVASVSDENELVSDENEVASVSNEVASVSVSNEVVSVSNDNFTPSITEVDGYEKANPMTKKKGLLFLREILNAINIDEMISQADDTIIIEGLGRAALTIHKICKM